MDIYTREFRVRSTEVDLDRRLKTSVLFSMLQEAAIAHTEALGMGRDKTLDKGLLWIVTQQQAQIIRMPEYDEDVILRSWPSESMHLIFPRYYSIDTAAGEPLIRASSFWSLMDARTRAIVFPENYGIVINGVHTGDEIPLPARVRSLKCSNDTEFTVPYSYTDLNGHMNNARYFDAAEDCIYDEVREKKLCAVCSEFTHEIRLGEKVTLLWGSKDDRYFVTGTREAPATEHATADNAAKTADIAEAKTPEQTKKQVCFKLSLEYRD